MTTTPVPPLSTADDALLAAVRGGLRVFDLGRPYFAGMPQSPNHPRYTHSLQRRHGDMVRADGGSAANDLLVMGTHVGTHVDALCHVSQDGRMHGGLRPEDAMAGGRFAELGADTIVPMVTRGLLLDVPAALGLDECAPGQLITPEDLERTERAQGVRVEAGDVVLIRTGWGRRFELGEEYVGARTGVPGIGEAGARWLAQRGIHAAGADSIAFEHLAPGAGHGLLPAHRVLLVEHGIYIFEALDLEALAAAAVHAFTFIASPLKLVGATGSPVRPLAVVPA
jgi:kynurenine formamidase